MKRVRLSHTFEGMDDVISVEGLHKSYGEVVAVEEVSFSVGRGEIFGLLGPNGAGKTTTVECLQGLRRPDSGTIEVLGIDPAVHPDRLRRRTGSQLQLSSLPDRLHVGEAVELFARLHGNHVDIPRVLERWDLTGISKKPFGSLSGGQKQRLFLALALLGNPEVVFLDELTSSLDPNARRVTWDLVREVRDQGATVVLVTHFMEEAEALCDRVAIVDGGRIVATGTPAGLTSGIDGEIRVTFSDFAGHLPELGRVPGVRSVTTDSGRVTVTGDTGIAVRIAATLLEDGLIPSDYRTHHPSLEDVFLALTGRTLTGKEAA